MTPSNENNEKPKVEPQVITVTRNVFDLTKFEPVSLKKDVKFVPSDTMEKALENAGGDEKQLLKIINSGERRVLISETKAGMGDDNLVSKKVVSGFANQFKPIFPATSDTKEAKKEQLSKIYAFIRGNEGLLAAIKSIAAAVAPDDDEEETEGDESES